MLFLKCCPADVPDRVTYCRVVVVVGPDVRARLCRLFASSIVSFLSIGCSLVENGFS